MRRAYSGILRKQLVLTLLSSRGHRGFDPHREQLFFCWFSCLFLCFLVVLSWFDVPGVHLHRVCLDGGEVCYVMGAFHTFGEFSIFLSVTDAPCYIGYL